MTALQAASKDIDRKLKVSRSSATIQVHEDMRGQPDTGPRRGRILSVASVLRSGRVANEGVQPVASGALIQHSRNRMTQWRALAQSPRTERTHCFVMSCQELHQRGLAGTGFAIDPIAAKVSLPLC
jgi:hypothetical protein